MEFLIILIVLVFIIFYLIRPTSKRGAQKDLKKRIIGLTWDFKKIQLTKIDCNLFEVLLIDC